LREAHEAIARLLATGEDLANLVDALEVSRYEEPGFPDLYSQVRAKSTVGYWYAETKAHKRATPAGRSKQDWQRIEDVLENAVVALNTGIIATQHTQNHTERFN